MCFAPQRRALFRHLNFEKWPESVVFLTFWRALFRHLNFERCSEHGVFCTFSRCASRHNCEHFFISHLARRLRTRRFSEPTFRPSGVTNHWKNTVFRDFPTFSRIWASSDSFSSTLLFSLTLPASAFHLSILSQVWLLNFLRVFIQIFFYTTRYEHSLLFCAVWLNWALGIAGWPGLQVGDRLRAEGRRKHGGHHLLAAA